jgi:hypothetical protein
VLGKVGRERLGLVLLEHKGDHVMHVLVDKVVFRELEKGSLGLLGGRGIVEKVGIKTNRGRRRRTTTTTTINQSINQFSPNRRQES